MFVGYQNWRVVSHVGKAERVHSMGGKAAWLFQKQLKRRLNVRGGLGLPRHR